MTNYSSVDRFLAHYGVKGMRWGVKKDRYLDSYDKDSVLKKGTTIQNISGRKEREVGSNPIYGAHTQKDRLNYASYYASQLKEFEGIRTVYKNDLKVVKDIKIPSEKKAAELFQETFVKNPDIMIRSITKARADMAFFGSMGKSFGLDVESRTVRNYSTKGEDWIKTKGYSQFNQTLVSSKSFEARKEYFDTLLGKGYGGIRDVNDINNSYKSEEPVIVINPSGSLRKGSAVKLPLKEINSSLADYKAQYGRFS